MTAPVRIICIGNRFHQRDCAGPMIFDCLVQHELGEDIELIDGGVSGLDLLQFVDGATCLVFVDTITQVDDPDGVVVLRRQEIAPPPDGLLDHASGLSYLLHIMPEVCDGPIPKTFVVGIESPPTSTTVERAATVCLELAHGNTGKWSALNVASERVST